MNDKERLLRALNSLAEVGEKRKTQQEEERKTEADKVKRRKMLYDQYYGCSSPMSFYVPEDSVLLDTNEGKMSK